MRQKQPALPRKKTFLSVQTALAVTLAAMPLIVLGETTYDDYVLNNSAVDLFTNNNYFDLSGAEQVIIGDVNGSENTVTLTTGSGQHVIGELRDASPDSADEWAEGNTVSLSAGTYGDVAGGVGTGQAGAGRHNAGVVNGGGNVVNISGGTFNLGVFGGFAAGTGNATNNKVNITGGTFADSDEIYGGYASGGQANDNSVTINASSSFDNIEKIIGGRAGTSANNNHVTIEDGAFSENTFDIAGAEAYNGDATGNSVTITGGTFTDTAPGAGDDINIVGGTSTNGNATGNTVNISGGVFYPDSGDHLSIVGGVVGSGNGNATGNTVNLSGAVDLSGAEVEIYAGGLLSGNGNATGNTVNVSDSVSLTNAQFYGGKIESGSGDVFTGNTLNFLGSWSGTIGNVVNFAKITFGNNSNLTGGNVTLGSAAQTTEIQVASGSATLNATLSGTGLVKTGAGALTLGGTNGHGTTTVDAGTLTIASDAPLGTGDNTLGNATLNLTGASYAKNWRIADGANSTIKSGSNTTLNGNYVFAGTGWLTFDSPGKTFTISGSIKNASGGNLIVDDGTSLKLNNTTPGSYSYTGETIVGENAKLELAASVTLDNNHLTLEEGAVFDKNGGTHSLAGGTLTVTNAATYKGDLNAKGATVNFQVTDNYNPATASSPILFVDGNADLDNATLTAAVEGASATVTRGDELNLLEVGGSFSADNATSATVSDQGLINIELGDLTNTGSGITGTITGMIVSVDANEKAKAFVEGFLGGAAALTGAGDHAAQSGLASAAASVTAAGGAARLVGFADVSGGSLQYETGSHIDVDGYNLIGGLASGSQFSAGDLTVGAFVEYGEGDLSTYNSFASGRVKGKGDTDYTGGGALVRFAFANGLYLDGTLRLGKVDVDFRSTQIVNGTRTAYDTSSRYYGAHLGVGKVWRLGENNSLDVSAQYLWTHQKGDRANIKGVTGMELDFDDVDSNRLR
ncbi:MAG: autotransporter outer membrane beta-barrel domain-containing protein, partial [Zoogloeaceae bacterium]|nr:autotransporter outer membrane beta-barrel domain-containing protein [Zoogloeaceae bacterium]